MSLKMSRRLSETKSCNSTRYYNYRSASNGGRGRAGWNVGKTGGRSSILLYVIIATLTVQCESLEHPDIFPAAPVVVEKGQQLKLTCQGEEPLEWRLPNDHDTSGVSSDPRLNITSLVNSTLTKPHISILTLSNVSVIDVGGYTCSYNGTIPDNSEDDTTSEIVYVHVIDEDNLLIKPKIEAPHAYVNSDIIVPCLGSWPAVQVELLNASDHYKPVPFNTPNIEYSNTKGVIIRNVSRSYYGPYKCRGTFGNISSREYSFTLLVLDVPKLSATAPKINITNGGFIKEGDTFTVRCISKQMEGFFYKLEIEGYPPSLLNSSRKKEKQYEAQNPNAHGTKTFIREMTVTEGRKEDSGNYSCVVRPIRSDAAIRTASQLVAVFDEGEDHLEIFTAAENITVKRDTTASWVINITSFPLNFNSSWLDQKGDPVKVKEKGGKYTMALTTQGNTREYLLQIHEVSLDDTGSHPFIVELPGSGRRKQLNLYLTVTAPPTATLLPEGLQVNCLDGNKCILNCTVKAYPPADIKWTSRRCTSPTDCDSPTKVEETWRKGVDHGNTSVIEFIPIQHGIYTCSANNSRNRTIVSKEIRVVDADFVGNEPISIIVKPEEVVEGDDVEIICAVSKYDDPKEAIMLSRLVDNYTWTHYEEAKLKSNETKWSRRTALEIKSIKQSSTGDYKCFIQGHDHIQAMKHINVLSASAPRLLETTNLNKSSASLKIGDTMELRCEAVGHPKPTIIWTLDDQTMPNWPVDLKYKLSADLTLLTLTYVPKEAQGRYTCTTVNRNGTASAYVDISVTGTRTFSNVAVAVILFLFLIVVIVGVILARYIYKRQEIERFMREVSQKDFYQGAVENINPELSVTDQAYLLPFEDHWEFPKDRLKFGIQLGSGAFGRVLKADAFGILDTEQKTTVAVKMVKPNADNSHFKALMSELKIMVHLGKHINVVNLLGACTKNLAKKKELLVIVEYCKYGSLLSYMHRNKRTFINQLDPARGIIDPNIDRPNERNSAQSQGQRKPTVNGYRTLDEFNGPNPDDRPINSQNIELDLEHNDGGYLTPNRGSVEHYVAESQVESACTGISYLSNGPTTMTTDGTTKRRSSCGSQWQDNYRGDYQIREVQPIKTTDLLCWAFQIARGMEYLASRKVLHGDLAGRNVLLAENNVVKICDFGLAKEMYKDYKYKKKSEGLLPVKWMAIESIYYGLFSTQSDCWSFGVVLWELFTLGKTPYPGMEADERFYKRLAEGYRMEKPPLAPSCVYDIMLECWAQEATERPSFSALVDRIGDMMEVGLRTYYVDLNTEYMRINQNYMSGRTDYLSQMGRSEFNPTSARQTPERQYQNVPEELDSSGYLRPITLSPTDTNSSSSDRYYQNINATTVEPTVVAVNNGYQFINNKPFDTAEATARKLGNMDSNKMLTLQINCSPDIKEAYGLRGDSTTPDRNSIVESPLDERHLDIVMGNNGIRGVDNMNYVPNHSLFNKLHKTSPHVEMNKVTDDASNSVENGRRQKRQKNDSGLGSIDSSHFEQNKYNSADNSHQCSEFGHFRPSNGYVTHQNITSLS